MYVKQLENYSEKNVIFLILNLNFYLLKCFTLNKTWPTLWHLHILSKKLNFTNSLVSQTSHNFEKSEKQLMRKSFGNLLNLRTYQIISVFLVLFVCKWNSNFIVHFFHFFYSFWIMETIIVLRKIKKKLIRLYLKCSKFWQP